MKIDFHAHVLPGLDHGCKDVQESLIQLSLAGKVGIDYIVSTSHFYPHSDTVHDFIKKRNESYELIKPHIEQDNPRLLLAAEVLLCKGMDKMEGLELLCVEGTDIMLLELPMGGKWDTNLIETIFRIEDEKNIRIVLAHVERYPFEDIFGIINRGILVQMNADYLSSYGWKKLYRICLKRNLLVGLGSDIHGIKHGYHSYKRAEKKIGKYNFEMIMNRSARLLRLI